MQTPAIHTSLGRTERFICGPGDASILQALSRYYVLSAHQVCRLMYSRGSLSWSQTRLKYLTDMGLCQRIYLPRLGRFGSSPSLVTLARKGLNCLKSQGVEVDNRYRPSEKKEHGYLFLHHTMAVNDFLIAAELLCRRVADLRLETMLHERILKREPIYVQDGEAKLPVIPDGWLDLRLAGDQQACFAVECDCGTEEQKKWRRKVRALLAWADGPYKERFNTTSLTITVVTTAGPKRQMDLIRWTEAELAARGQEAYADLFRFTSALPDAVEPEELFLSPCWLRPFARQTRESHVATLADYQGMPLLTLPR